MGDVKAKMTIIWETFFLHSDGWDEHTILHKCI